MRPDHWNYVWRWSGPHSFSSVNTMHPGRQWRTTCITDEVQNWFCIDESDMEQQTTTDLSVMDSFVSFWFAYLASFNFVHLISLSIYLMPLALLMVLDAFSLPSLLLYTCRPRRAARLFDISKHELFDVISYGDETRAHTSTTWPNECGSHWTPNYHSRQDQEEHERNWDMKVCWTSWGVGNRRWDMACKLHVSEKKMLLSRYKS